MEYKTRVCMEIMNYIFQEGKMTFPEMKAWLIIVFDENAIEQASAFLRGQQRPTLHAPDAAKSAAEIE